MLETIFKVYAPHCHALFVDPSKSTTVAQYLKSKGVFFRRTKVLYNGYVKYTLTALPQPLIDAFTAKFSCVKAEYHIKKIISGGQSGADVAGLVAAERLGIPTGGTAPLGYKCCESKTGKTVYKPEVLRDRFGLKESPSSSYQPRTLQNVIDSDVTLVFGDITSAGSKLTINYCKQKNKPCLLNPTVNELRLWISDNEPRVINVAGNRECKNPGIFHQVVATLEQVLVNFK